MNVRRVVRFGVWAAIGALAAGVPGYWMNGGDILKMYDGLLSVAGISFGVSGAFIAIVYAEQSVKDRPDAEHAFGLICSMIAATIVVLLVLAATYLSQIVRTFVPVGFAPYAKAAALAGWFFCCAILVWSLAGVLGPAAALFELLRGKGFLNGDASGDDQQGR